MRELWKPPKFMHKCELENLVEISLCQKRPQRRGRVKPAVPGARARRRRNPTVEFARGGYLPSPLIKEFNRHETRTEYR